MFEPSKTILTGGSGLLGAALRRLLPELIAPPVEEFDVRSADVMARFLRGTGGVGGHPRRRVYLRRRVLTRTPAMRWM